MVSHHKQKEVTAFELTKDKCPIGIFGSFKFGRIEHLRGLKDYLNLNNYLAQISLDLDQHSRDPIFKKPPGYDLKISKNLINQSNIHIFVFNHESKREHYTHDSPLIELTLLYSKIESNQIVTPNVLIYMQKGIENEVGSLLKDLISDKSLWNPYSYKKLEDIHEHALMSCHNFIEKYR
mgnify:CR=1 FL=1